MIKSSQNTILGICIPTYNRKEKLESKLHNLIPKLLPYSIPIFISDNNQNYETKAMVLNFKNKMYPHIVYSKNNGKNTYSWNFLNCLSLANTEYVWFLSDDDEIFDYAIDNVITYLSQGYDFLASIHVGYNSKLQEMLPKQFPRPNSDIIYQNDEVFKVISESFNLNGFISYLITRRSYLNNVLLQVKLDNDSPYIHTLLWSHMFFVNNVTSGITLSAPLIKWRLSYEIESMKKSRFSLEFDHRQIFLDIDQTYGTQLVRMFDGPFQVNLLLKGIGWRIIQDLNLQELFKVLKLNGTTIHINTKFLLFFISICPPFLISFGVSLKNIISKKN